MLWTEKYRPNNFKDLYGQKLILERAKAFVDQKNVPNMLLAGPAGCGKTSLILVIARELFKEDWKQSVLELNASDDRGINIVRENIKNFAKTKAIGDIPFKICILDEADSLTKEAQQALRRTMENYSKSCRFCLLANYSSKIIDPIQSRCTVFRFKLLEKEEISDLIKGIAKKENLKIDEKAINVLYEATSGDARRITNILQSCATINNKITEELVYQLVSAAKPEEIKNILKLAINKEFLKSRDNLLNLMLKQGLSGLDIIKQIQKEIWNLNIPNEKKIKLIDKCGEIEFRMVEGSDEFVQLEALLANFMG